MCLCEKIVYSSMKTEHGKSVIKLVFKATMKINQCTQYKENSKFSPPLQYCEGDQFSGLEISLCQ